MQLGPDYRIQLGDGLKVAFLFQPENDMDLVVRPDGRISLAAAGELEAVGKTEQELEGRSGSAPPSTCVTPW
jgi:protein involved in polysaccharide export with SLBB domain